VARLLLLALGLILTGPLAAQTTHVVRLTQSGDGALFRFSPGRLTVRPGDQVEFRAERGAPFVVSFASSDLTPRARALLASALADGPGELRSPVLADSGSRYRWTVPALAAGTYRFFCLAHLSYRMGGLLVVQ
jgi:plastocyanin